MSEIQPIGLLYVKLFKDSNRFKLRICGEIVRNIIETECLKVQLTVKIIV